MADSDSGRAGKLPEASEHAATAPPGAPQAIDPVAIIRSRPYIGALVLAAIVGIPVSVIAYGFLALVAAIQKFLFTPAPAWWPVPWPQCCGCR